MKSLHKFLIFIVTMLFATLVKGEQQPVWELGIGAGLLSAPDYRGSDERQNRVLPIPYVIYRGERLNIDRRRISGLIFEGDRVRFDISANASVPVDSDKNQARRGMPDLDPAVEIGPSLSINLWEDQARKFEVSFELPLRAVIATDLSRVKSIGGVFNPRINLDWRDAGNSGWNLGAGFGPIFANKKYHDYFYTVDPIYATAGRPAYVAKAGYSGLQLTTSASRRFGNLWVGGFIRADDLHGATIEDSPLVKSKQTVMVGFGVAWIFAKSSQLTSRED